MQYEYTATYKSTPEKANYRHIIQHVEGVVPWVLATALLWMDTNVKYYYLFFIKSVRYKHNLLLMFFNFT